MATETTETSIAQTPRSLKSCSVNLSWDADLRALAAPAVVEKSITQKQKRKRLEESVTEPGISKKPKEKLNKTEEEVQKIENTPNATEKLETSWEDVKKNKKVAAGSRRNRITTKKAISASKIIKSESERQARLKITEVSLSIPESSNAVMEISSSENAIPSVENQQKTSEENQPEKQYAVINRHVKPRIRKKCNMENPVKKPSVPEEIILTNITKIKSCEILDETKNKLILSPSKLNANKRTLVEAENRSPVTETNLVVKAVDDPQEITDNFISPELVKNSSNIPSTAKRNIMPGLETPVKSDMVPLPKTPSIFTSPTVDTPFTKAVLDQLTEVDINTIPTPKFPVTPHVPFTPCMGSEQSPFSNRGTDYSTCSSYYQPSDTEQNKSVEQLLEEYRKMENQSAKTSELQENPDVVSEGTSVSVNKSCQKSQTSETTKKTETDNQSNASQSPDVVNTSVTDKMKAFNNSLIGKKNLQLMKMFSAEVERDESSSSDGSSTGSSSSTSSDDSDSSESSCNDNEIKTKSAKNASPYSLRPRRSLTSNHASDQTANKQQEECQKPVADKDRPAEKSKEKPMTFQDGLLQEMEEKRQRTIARFKDANLTAKTKDHSKQQKQTSKSKGSASKLPKRDECGRFLKSSVSKQPISVKSKADATKTSPVTENTAKSMEKNSSSQQQKSDSLEKLNQLENRQKNEDSGTSISFHQTSVAKTSFFTTKMAKAIVNDDKEIILHLSSDDENLEPSQIVEAVLLECSASSPCNADENRNDYSVNSDCNLQPQESALCKNLDMTAERENQGSPDQEVETMVKLKGLMQMGIHLIPNKSSKKPVISSEKSERTVDAKDNIVEINVNQTMEVSAENMRNRCGTDSLQKPEVAQKELQKPSTSKEKFENLEKICASIEKPESLGKSSVVREKTEKLRKLSSSKENLEKPQTTKRKSESPRKLQKSSNENLEKAFPKSEPGNSKKPERIPKGTPKNKQNDMTNSSLEDGELLSDSDSSPRKDNNVDNCRTEKVKKIEPKRMIHPCKHGDGVKKRVSQEDYLREFREAYKYRPKLKNKTKECTASTSDKSSASSKSSKPHVNKNVSKKTQSLDKVPEKAPEVKSKNDGITSSEKQPIVSEFDYDMQFDIKTYSEETCTIKHDYSKKINRKLSDYNLDILTKKFSANVYIAEIDAEVEKFLTFTPFQFLMDITPKPLKSGEKRTSSTSKSEQSHTSQGSSKKKKTPLNILYNEIIKPASEISRSSPLEDLYDSKSSSSRDYRKSSEGSHVKVTDKGRKNEKPEKINKSKQKPVKERSLKEEPDQRISKLTSKESAVDDGVKKTEVEESVSFVNMGKSKCMEPLASSNEQDLKNTGDKSGSHEEGKKCFTDLEQNLDVVDGVIMLNTNNELKKHEESKANLETTHDELMNYALVGSERVQENDDSFIVENRKRKASEEKEEKQEKKQKTEELLRNIDVDSFLKKLHGET